jgi:toxin FitB
VNVLLDTNILSKLRKGPQANERARAWDSRIDPNERFISVMCIAELMKGAALLSRKDINSGAALERWIGGVVTEFERRILPVDLVVSSVWARLMAQRSRPPVDTLIAATAIAHGCTLVTRNVSDFEGTGTALLDPWTFAG